MSAAVTAPLDLPTSSRLTAPGGALGLLAASAAGSRSGPLPTEPSREQAMTLITSKDGAQIYYTQIYYKDWGQGQSMEYACGGPLDNPDPRPAKVRPKAALKLYEDLLAFIRS
jgi:hypothetical protein